MLRQVTSLTTSYVAPGGAYSILEYLGFFVKTVGRWFEPFPRKGIFLHSRAPEKFLNLLLRVAKVAQFRYRIVVAQPGDLEQ